jgi:predicted O-methyltransferase YrrM
MDKELWTAVDHYFVEKLIPPDPIWELVSSANAAAGLPHIDVAPNLGKLLHLIARIQRAQRILEIGTLGGYSAIWLARALPPDGRLITLEAEAKHADVARGNIARAGVSSLVDVRLGPALDSLQKLWQESSQPFDLIFIDADKENNPAYLEWSLRLSRPGTLIICDNVVRDGAVIDANSSNAAVQGTRRFFEMLAADPRLDATALQTVGVKGYDGFAMALVVSNGQKSGG